MMTSKNSFSINLNQQKSIAKKRLKAIRSGDIALLECVQKHHIKPDSINADSIQLADVQHALARELGLVSWSKLKQHVELLEQHRQAIEQHAPALDSELKTLHVRCGHDIQITLQQSGFVGEFLPFIDPLCMGRVPNQEQGFLAERADYVRQTLLPIMGIDQSLEEICHSEQQKMSRLASDDIERIVIWVEHDSYDQLILLRLLTLLENLDSEQRVVELIEFNQFPGTERFIGLGQLPKEALRLCWQHRRAVTAKMYAQAKRCWQALVEDKPSALLEVLSHHQLDCLPNMSQALKRHLQELPHHQTGLGLTQKIALQCLAESVEPMPVSQWFKSYMAKEPLPYLGDVMFYALILPLSKGSEPLIQLTPLAKPWNKQQVSLTVKGRECLAGDHFTKQDYWLGGVHVKPNQTWCWDHVDFSSFTLQVLSR